MFIMPLVFLCNTLIFIFALKERFKIYLTTIFAAVSFIISLLFGSGIANFFAYTIDESVASSSFNLVILTIAAIFFSSNNIAHKVMLALTIQFNFIACMTIVPQILSVVSITSGGVTPMIIASLLYVVLSLLTIAIFKGPMQHFFRTRVNIYSCFSCFVMFLACIFINGFVSDAISVNSFNVKFFTGIIPYVIVLMSLRAVYSNAKLKEKDFLRKNTEVCSSFVLSNINSMVNEVNIYKSIKKGIEYNYSKIEELAYSDENSAVRDFINGSDFEESFNPFVKYYNDDACINAIIANKTVYAENNNIKLSSDIDINTKDSRINDIYVMINQMLDVAFKSALQFNDEAFINISNHQSKNLTSYEIEFSQNKKKKFVETVNFKALIDPSEYKRLFSSTYEILFSNIFGERTNSNNSDFDFLVDVVNKLNGTMKVSTASDYASINILIKH